MAIALDGGLTDWTSADRLDLSGGGVAGYGLYGRYEAGNFVFAISLLPLLARTQRCG